MSMNTNERIRRVKKHPLNISTYVSFFVQGSLHPIDFQMCGIYTKKHIKRTEQKPAFRFARLCIAFNYLPYALLLPK